MTDRRFRQLIVLSFALLVAAAVAGLVPGGYSAQLAAAYSNEPESWLLSKGWPSVALLLVYICIVVAGYIGLFMLKAWGRSLSLYTTVIGFMLYPLMGPALTSPLESLLTDASTLLWGAVLALAYFSPISVRLSANNSFKPKPLRGSA